MPTWTREALLSEKTQKNVCLDHQHATAGTHQMGPDSAVIDSTMLTGWALKLVALA